MLATRLFLPGLLLAPLLSAAQISPLPRYYVGLALYGSDYQHLGSRAYQFPQLPVQLTLGYQWQPRLAVQASVAYSQYEYSYFGLGNYYTGTRAAASPYAYFSDSSTFSWHYLTVALLGRYTLTRQVGHRFQADVLGGFTLEYQNFRATARHTDSDSTQTRHVTTDYDDLTRRTNLLVTAGLSARYRFGRHLEAVLDATLNQRLLGNSAAYFPTPTGSAALGLRYRFGYW